jgi:hypothetical protein
MFFYLFIETITFHIIDMRCVLLCEPSSLFYLLILFPYKSVTEVRLIFFCKQIYLKKQDLHFSVSRVSRVTQTS